MRAGHSGHGDSRGSSNQRDAEHFCFACWEGMNLGGDSASRKPGKVRVRKATLRELQEAEKTARSRG